MTKKDLLCAICDANDAGVDKVAIYEPQIKRARRDKRGWTTITLEVRVGEFQPSDLLDGMVAYLALSTHEALRQLERPK